MGAERQVVICRELTKRFEEFIRGSAEEVVAGPKKQKSEGKSA